MALAKGKTISERLALTAHVHLPVGRTATFFVFLRSIKMDLAPGLTCNQLDAALQGRILAEAEFMGSYRRDQEN